MFDRVLNTHLITIIACLLSTFSVLAFFSKQSNADKIDWFDIIRGGSRAAATSKMDWFVIIVNGLKSLTIITKHFILDVAAALDPPLIILLIVIVLMINVLFLYFSTFLYVLFPCSTAQTLKISSVNVTKSAVSWGFGHICWKDPYWKTSF